jgi:hypothetical protein
MSLKHLADELAARGRYGDTELVHMSKGEVAGLQQLAQSAGGSLTINPDTGKPEAFFLAALLPTLLGAAAPALGAAATGAGLTGLGGLLGSKMGAAGLGALAGGLANRDNPLMGALMGGLGGFGGFGLGQGLMGVGAGVGATAPAQAASMVAPTAAIDAGSQAAMLAAQNAAVPTAQLAQYGSQALPTMAPMSASQQMMTGIGESFRNPAQLVQELGGTSGALRTGAMAAAPLMTPSRRSGSQEPERDTREIPQYDYTAELTGDYYQPGMGQGSYERDFFTTPTFTRRAAAGGIMQLAKGGMKEGAFIVAADIPSLVGEGNTEAGYREISAVLPGAMPIRGKDKGQADTVKTSIEGKQPARVAHGEMYVPPAAVKRAGGAKKLYAMMDSVRKQATGNKKQIKPVDIRKALA